MASGVNIKHNEQKQRRLRRVLYFSGKAHTRGRSFLYLSPAKGWRKNDRKNVPFYFFPGCDMQKKFYFQGNLRLTQP
jgi:hypothetical protein